MHYTNKVRPVTLKSLEGLESRDYFNSIKLSVCKYNNAVLLPSTKMGGGGLYADGEYVEWSNFNGNIVKHYDGDCEYCDEDVLYIGMMFGVWGHCLTDFLSHVWPMLDKKYSKIVYLGVSPDSKMPNNYFRLLEALGGEENTIVRITRPTQFRSVCFGEPSMMSPAAAADGDEFHRYYTKEYSDTIDRVIDYYNKKYVSINSVESNMAIYLSRQGWKRGCVDFGEYLIEEAFFKSWGCRIVHPEELSLEEMIQMLSRCSTLIATEGSVAHNSLFLKKGARLISIRKGDYINGYQTVINQVRDLETTYIDANYTYIYPFGDEPWFGPFFLAVNNRLAEFLGCKTTPVHKLLRPFCQFTLRYVFSKTHKWLYRQKMNFVRYLSMLNEEGVV